MCTCQSLPRRAFWPPRCCGLQWRCPLLSEVCCPCSNCTTVPFHLLHSNAGLRYVLLGRRGSTCTVPLLERAAQLSMNLKWRFPEGKLHYNVDYPAEMWVFRSAISGKASSKVIDYLKICWYRSWCHPFGNHAAFADGRPTNADNWPRDRPNFSKSAHSIAGRCLTDLLPWMEVPLCPPLFPRGSGQWSRYSPVRCLCRCTPALLRHTLSRLPRSSTRVM